ncbi:MAG: HdeA family protein [Methylophilaceae bacterium]
MKSSIKIAVLSGILLTSFMISPSFAATTKSTMTCEEFLQFDDVVKPKVVYWVHGFTWDNKGKHKEATIDIDETEKMIPVVIEECQKTPKATLMEKVKKAIKAL